ncbi:TPA: hypothetical protein ACIAPS_004172 [Salmonella enterica subsp. enterica serovar Bovismorbificans]
MNNIRVLKLQITYIVALLSTILTLCLTYTFFGKQNGSEITLTMLLIAVICWSTILYSSIKTKQMVKKIVSTIYNETNPSDIVSIYNWLTGRYFGINKNTGDILIIALNMKGQQIFGFDYQSWSGYEIYGNKLTLKFNNLDMPYFVINDVEAPKFKHKLDVFLSNVFQHSVTPNAKFSSIVENKMKVASLI